MRLFLTLVMLCCAERALAQAPASDAGTPVQAPSAREQTSVQPAEPVIEGEQEFQLREPGTDFCWQPPPAAGTCLGGSCASALPPSAAPRWVPLPPPPSGYRAPGQTRMRFAYAGGVLGTVSAGLVLGGAIAIALVDDLDSERITRGVWLGTFALSTGVVALSSALARRELGGGGANKAVRSIGWTAFALALADGAILWAGAFQRFTNVDPLTIGAGAIGACALLPHALDAYLAGRGLRARNMVSLEPVPNGLRVRF